MTQLCCDDTTRCDDTFGDDRGADDTTRCDDTFGDDRERMTQLCCDDTFGDDRGADDASRGEITKSLLLFEE